MAALIQRHRVVLFLGLVAVALTGLVLVYGLRSRTRSPLLLSLTPAATAAATTTPTPTPIRVYVSGAVLHPDVYTLPAGSIVKDALLAAGGAGADADLDRINLALTLTDGQQVHVPRQGEEALPLQRSVPAQGLGRVNINSATASELEALPGIGPVTAQRIIDYRQAQGPFRLIEDIMEVPGIGPATFDKIKGLISID